jgi:hypothetical protein
MLHPAIQLRCKVSAGPAENNFRLGYLASSQQD